MILEQETLEGFLSYRKRQTIDLRGLSVCLINGARDGDVSLSNGAGKSALLESMLVNFYGKFGGRGKLIDWYINHDSSSMYLEHIFLMDGKRYKKILKKSKESSATNELFYDRNNKTLEEAEWKLTDKKIDDVLGLTCEAASSTIFLSERETLKFINGTSSERKEILRELLNIIIFEKASKKTSRKALDIDKDINVNIALIGSKQEQLNVEGDIKIKVDDVKDEIKKLKAFEDEFKAKIKAVQDEKKNLAVEIEKQKDLAAKLLEETQKTKELEKELENKQKQLDELVKAGTDCKKSLETKKQDLEKLKQKQFDAQPNINSIQKFIDALKKEINEIVDVESSDVKLKEVEDLKRKTKELQNELNELIKKKSEIETKNEHVQEYVAKIDKFGKICPIIELECNIITDEYKSKIKLEKEKEIQAYEKTGKKAEAKIKELKEQIEKNQTTEQSILDGIKKQNELRSNNERIKKNKQKELESSIKNLEVHKETLNKINLEIKENEVEIKASEKSIEEKRELYEKAEVEVEKFQSKANKAKNDVIGLERKIRKDLDLLLDKKTKEVETLETDIKKTQELLIEKNKQLVLVQEKEKRIENLKKEIDNIIEKNKKLTYDKEVQLTLTNIFGKDGIQKVIMKQAVPILEETSNELVQLFNSGSDQVKIRFDLDPTKSDGEFKKEGGLDILILEEGREPKDIVMYSGGETVRIVFAIILSLSRLLTKRSGKKHETLIIDEKIAKLDSSGKEQFYEIIKTISEWYKKIFIITHITELKDLFENNNEIFVNKTAEGSVAEVIK
jgi:exonuclease SbcC